MKPWKIAGINFDHMHMGDLLRMVHEHPNAEIVGISKQALTRWRAVPLKYVRVIHEKTGIARADLLPSEFA